MKRRLYWPDTWFPPINLWNAPAKGDTEMAKRRLLADELRDLFIQLQHQLESHPTDPTIDGAKARLKYRTDPVFRQNVDATVSATLEIVDKHITEGRD